MQILIGADVPPDPNSGAAGTVWHTTAALRELGHEVDDFWSEQIGRRIQHGNLHYVLELPWRYRQLVRRYSAMHSYDAIQLSQPHAFLAARDHRLQQRHGVFVNRSHGLELRYNEVMAAWSAQMGLPTHQGPKKIISKGLAWLLESHWRWVSQWADGIILCSELDREYLLQRLPVPEWRVRTIHHGVTQAFSDTPAPPMSPARLDRMLHIAQFDAVKGPDITAEIANRLLPSNPKLSLTWVTSARHHPAILKLLAAEVEPRVQLLDWRDQSELIPLLDAHGIFLFPSYFEGAGKACLEALSRGLCVVASDNGAMQGYIRHGVNGYLAPPGDVVRMIDSIERLRAAPDAAVALAAAARHEARQLSWKRCAQAAVDFYAELSERKARAVPGRPNYV